MLIAVLGPGCGSAELDRQMAQAASRACASLVERRVAGQAVPFDIAGTEVDIREDPEGFYAALAARRGPDAFDPADPTARFKTRASITGDKCDVEPVSSSSSAASSSSKATEEEAVEGVLEAEATPQGEPQPPHDPPSPDQPTAPEPDGTPPQDAGPEGHAPAAPLGGKIATARGANGHG